MVEVTTKGPWQKQTPGRRKSALATIKECGRQGQTWACTAALVGVSERCLRNWKADDASGKISTAYEAGRQETGAKLAKRLQAKALDPDEDGNTVALVHATKHFLKMSDKITASVVTPSDLAGDGPGDAKARRSAALRILDLSALDGPDEGEEQGDPTDK